MRAREETGEYLCGVCCKGVGANSIQCTTCVKWVHRMQRDCWEPAGGERCMCARGGGGVLPQRSTVGKGEHFMLDGEKYEVVSRFCYLGDMIDAGGGADVVVTARIRSGWKKFRELAPFLTFQSITPKNKRQSVHSMRTEMYDLRQ